MCMTINAAERETCKTCETKKENAIICRPPVSQELMGRVEDSMRQRAEDRAAGKPEEPYEPAASVHLDYYTSEYAERIRA